MFLKLFKFTVLMLILIPFVFISCGEEQLSEEEFLSQIELENILPQALTLINHQSGEKTYERISRSDFKPGYDYRISNIIETWNIENGDIFFLRAAPARHNSAGDMFYMIPLEDKFYWNAVCLYYDGFCYQAINTGEGIKIYNSKLWKLGRYYIIAQLSPKGILPSGGENQANQGMLENIHKVKIKRGGIKRGHLEADNPLVMTAPGLVWKYYRNLGKEIRKVKTEQELADQTVDYVMAEDFIIKTDTTEDGYFRSASEHFTVKNVYVSSYCEKIW